MEDDFSEKLLEDICTVAQEKVLFYACPDLATPTGQLSIKEHWKQIEGEISKCMKRGAW